MHEFWFEKIIKEKESNEIISFFRKEIEDRINNNTGFELTIKELKLLEENLSEKELKKLKKCGIWLYFDSPTMISYTEYKNIYNNYKIFGLFVDGFTPAGWNGKGEGINTNNEDLSCHERIDEKIMLIYLKKLDEITKDFKDKKLSINELEIFCILCNRIVEQVSLDFSLEEKNSPKKYYSLWRVPNEMIGLIDHTAVCRGFAGIVRDTCKLLGIETKTIVGKGINYGHAWNQVKLNGKWYNLDLTWDYQEILNKSKTYYFLTSDIDFYKYGKLNKDTGEVITHNTFNHKREKMCFESISDELIDKFLYKEERKKEIWLKGLIEQMKKQGGFKK